MKANRKFVEAEEAVSPVIAVILMVAITVVLAATVFVLVSDIGQNTQQSGPQVGWSDNENDDRWEVSQAPSQIGWNEFEIRATALSTGMTSYKFAINADSNGGTAPAVGDETDYVAVTDPDDVQAGDYVEFCATGVDGEDVEFVFRHVESNSIAHRFTFDSVETCA